jgi:hypothetical protein
VKRLALTLVTLILLTGCATVQKPAPVIQACPKVPELELDAPGRDWLQEMQSFLQGTPPMPKEHKRP